MSVLIPSSLLSDLLCLVFRIALFQHVNRWCRLFFFEFYLISFFYNFLMQSTHILNISHWSSKLFFYFNLMLFNQDSHFYFVFSVAHLFLFVYFCIFLFDLFIYLLYVWYRLYLLPIYNVQYFSSYLKGFLCSDYVVL